MGSTPIGVIASKIPENLEPARAVFSGIFSFRYSADANRFAGANALSPPSPCHKQHRRPALHPQTRLADRLFSAILVL